MAVEEVDLIKLPRPITEYYRYVNREMVGPSAERTLISCIVPKGLTNIHTVFQIVFISFETCVAYCSATLSIILDFLLKLSGKGHCNIGTASMLPHYERNSSASRAGSSPKLPHLGLRQPLARSCRSFDKRRQLDYRRFKTDQRIRTPLAGSRPQHLGLENPPTDGFRPPSGLAGD